MKLISATQTTPDRVCLEQEISILTQTLNIENHLQMLEESM